jgi:hypothetical protein
MGVCDYLHRSACRRPHVLVPGPDGRTGLSSIAVLNTELILNIGGILMGISLIAFLVPLTAHMSAKSGKA